MYNSFYKRKEVHDLSNKTDEEKRNIRKEKIASAYNNMNKLKDKTMSLVHICVIEEEEGENVQAVVSLNSKYREVIIEKLLQTARILLEG